MLRRHRRRPPFRPTDGRSPGEEKKGEEEEEEEDDEEAAEAKEEERNDLFDDLVHLPESISSTSTSSSSSSRRLPLLKRVVNPFKRVASTSDGSSGTKPILFSLFFVFCPGFLQNPGREGGGGGRDSSSFLSTLFLCVFITEKKRQKGDSREKKCFILFFSLFIL